ncbi:MAG: TldD/PmbA family protein [bacterium]|nr:TldD/PmbA family protein [bacterium]
MSPETLQTKPYDAPAQEARLTERAEQLMNLALAAGADEAEVFGAHSETISVGFEKGDLKLTTVDEGTSLGLRVFQNNRLGFSSTNQSGASSLETTARDANTLASFSLPDEANVLPEPRALDERPTLVTPEIAAYPVETAVERGHDFLSRALAVDPRLSIDQASFTVTRHTACNVSNKGVRAAESDAQLGLSVFGMAIDGDDVGGFDYWGDSLRDASRLDAAMDHSVRHFADGALGNLNAGAAETYRGPVLFAPQAFCEVFISPLVSASSAIAVQRGRSALADKIGERVAHESLFLHDDPTDRELAGAATFDREGMPAGKFTLVEGGKLSSYLYNAYAAAVEGRTSTGHASGGARAVPGLGPHSLSIAPGDGGDTAAMRARLGRGLVVQRFSGTVDPASGDFSGVAKSARWVENGEVVRSVKETLISGNAFELLGQIAALSTDAPTLMGATRAPWALIDGVSVTAG